MKPKTFSTDLEDRIVTREPPPCILCGSKNVIWRWNKVGGEYGRVRCRSCKLSTPNRIVQRD